MSEVLTETTEYLVIGAIDGSVYKVAKDSLKSSIIINEATIGDIHMSVAKRQVESMTNEVLLRVADRLEYGLIAPKLETLKEAKGKKAKMKFAWKSAKKCFMTAKQIDLIRDQF